MAQQTTTLAHLRVPSAQTQSMPVVNIGMETVQGFEGMQRIAKLFASSAIVPERFRDNIASSFIAVDMALRMGANPLLVMQNLYDVQGTPAWSAKFLIATFNKCGRFSAIRYQFQGEEGTDSWGCRAVTKELSSGEEISGPLITIALAKSEGWYNKNGSKWKTIPELMLRYRAAAWLVNTYAPEIAMGLRTVEEEEDRVYDITPEADGTYQMTTAEIRRPGENSETSEAPPADPAPATEGGAQRPAGRAKRAPAQDPPAGKSAAKPSAGSAPAQKSAPKQAAQPAPENPAPAEEETPEGEGDADPFDGGQFVTCPNNGKQVDEYDCLQKPCRNGCPAFLE